MEEVELGEGIQVRALGTGRTHGWGLWSGLANGRWGTVRAGEKKVGALEGVANGERGLVRGGASWRWWLAGAGPYRTWLLPWVSGAGRYRALDFFLRLEVGGDCDWRWRGGSCWRMPMSLWLPTPRLHFQAPEGACDGRRGSTQARWPTHKEEIPHSYGGGCGPSSWGRTRR